MAEHPKWYKKAKLNFEKPKNIKKNQKEKYKWQGDWSYQKNNLPQPHDKN